LVRRTTKVRWALLATLLFHRISLWALAGTAIAHTKSSANDGVSKMQDQSTGERNCREYSVHR
jgi:hypothetical protein